MQSWPTATEVQKQVIAAAAAGPPPVARIDAWPVLLRRSEFSLWSIDPSGITLRHVRVAIPPLATIPPPMDLFLPKRRNVLACGRASPVAAAMLVHGAAAELDCERLFEPLLVLAEEHEDSPFGHFNLSVTAAESAALIADDGTRLDALVWFDFDDRDTRRRQRTFETGARRHRARVALIPMPPIEARLAIELFFAVRAGKQTHEARQLYVHVTRSIEDAARRFR